MRRVLRVKKYGADEMDVEVDGEGLARALDEFVNGLLNTDLGKALNAALVEAHLGDPPR